MASLASDQNEWTAKQLDIMQSKSPTSMKVTHEQLLRGGGLEFRDNMRMEFRIVSRCMAGDFQEGVRAILIDKDNAPVWKPASLVDISEDDVDDYFAPLGAGRELAIQAGD